VPIHSFDQPAFVHVAVSLKPKQVFLVTTAMCDVVYVAW